MAISSEHGPEKDERQLCRENCERLAREVRQLCVTEGSDFEKFHGSVRFLLSAVGIYADILHTDRYAVQSGGSSERKRKEVLAAMDEEWDSFVHEVDPVLAMVEERMATMAAASGEGVRDRIEQLRTARDEVTRKIALKMRPLVPIVSPVPAEGGRSPNLHDVSDRTAALGDDVQRFRASLDRVMGGQEHDLDPTVLMQGYFEQLPRLVRGIVASASGNDGERQRKREYVSWIVGRLQELAGVPRPSNRPQWTRSTAKILASIDTVTRLLDNPVLSGSEWGPWCDEVLEGLATIRRQVDE